MSAAKRKVIKGKRLFVLDTNVLMHDPMALFNFSEHDIFLPMVVLEELDSAKKGLSEVSRNARQANRFLDSILENLDTDDVAKGISLAKSKYYTPPQEGAGRLLFQTESVSLQLPVDLPSTKADNTILAVTLALQNRHKSLPVTLVSKDINLRLKAKVLGIHTEDYFRDSVIDDIEQLYQGFSLLPENFWDTHSKTLESWQEEGITYYKIEGPLCETWKVNHCIYHEVDKFRATVDQVDGNTATIHVVKDFQNQANCVWGITARNTEQTFALHQLMDPNIDIVTLQGVAGTGKTLLTLAAALEQTIEMKRYSEIVMTRVTVPVGEDIGFLPGTEEEKMTPWMGALMDNLEVLSPDTSSNWQKDATNSVLMKYIKIRSLNFMRGRTFLNKFVIIDEAQNLTPHQMKTLITRAGPGTKFVCLGNIAQIDTPYLTPTNSGIAFVVDKFKGWQHAGHITLQRGERSRLAEYASDNL
jgi:PhoH-like ATPase